MSYHLLAISTCYNRERNLYGKCVRDFLVIFFGALMSVVGNKIKKRKKKKTIRKINKNYLEGKK